MSRNDAASGSVQLLKSERQNMKSSFILSSGGRLHDKIYLARWAFHTYMYKTHTETWQFHVSLPVLVKRRKIKTRWMLLNAMWIFIFDFFSIYINNIAPILYIQYFIVVVPFHTEVINNIQHGAVVLFAENGYNATDCIPWEMQRWKCEWEAAAVSCGLWWMTDSGLQVVHPWTPLVTFSMTSREWEEEKSEQRDMTQRRQEDGRQGKTWVDLFWVSLSSEPKDTVGGAGGCQNGNRTSSICHLSFSLSPRYLSPFSSASVLLFLASRGSGVKANKQWRLFICASGE